MKMGKTISFPEQKVEYRAEEVTNPKNKQWPVSGKLYSKRCLLFTNLETSNQVSLSLR